MKKTLEDEIKHREHTSISFSQIQKILTPASLRKNTVMKELDKLPEHCKDSDLFGSASNVCLFCNRYMNGRVVASHWVVLLHKQRKHGRNIVVAFHVRLGGKVEVSPICLRLTGECVLQILFRLAALERHEIFLRSINVVLS